MIFLSWIINPPIDGQFCQNDSAIPPAAQRNHGWLHRAPLGKGPKQSTAGACEGRGLLSFSCEQLEKALKSGLGIKRVMGFGSNEKTWTGSMEEMNQTSPVEVFNWTGLIRTGPLKTPRPNRFVYHTEPNWLNSKVLSSKDGNSPTWRNKSPRLS